ncbi:hypothetical protein JCM6882_002829 [Rhodosporidiobolus microsporus]
MNVRKAASTVPSTLSRQLKAGFLKTPPPSFYPLLAHPPPPSLVRSFPQRDEHDLPASARRTAAPSDAPARSLYQQAKDKLDAGIRLTAAEDAALLDPSPSASPSRANGQTRRKPPRASNTRRPKPLPIVFAEDKIRKRFFVDHPFEAYRPVSLVEGEKIKEVEGPQGAEWTELSQRSVVPSAEDCIAYIHNLTVAHSVPITQAYPHGVAQFRTLRAEHELATLSARNQATAFGAHFFGEIDRALAMEEKVLDQWENAREVQAQLQAGTTGPAGAPAGVGAPVVKTVEGAWAPVEARPAHLWGGEEESLFSGGVEYLQAFAKSPEAPSAAVAVGEGKLVGVEA